MCRAILIRSALESSDPGASNGVPNVEIEALGAGYSSRIARESGKNHENYFQLFGNSNFSKVARSAPKCRILKFGPPFDALRALLSSPL